MAYPTINGHRFLYNLDGTSVGYNNTTSFGNGVTTYFTQAEMDAMQTETNGFSSSDRCIWWFFPEEREITHILVPHTSTNGDLGKVNSFIFEGSNDTTNGIDGTWTTMIAPTNNNLSICPRSVSDSWRTPYEITQPATPYSFKTVRASYDPYYAEVMYIHIYGRKASGANPDDIVFLKADGTTDYTALHDFGATEEGQTYNVDVYIKNSSATFTANTVNVTIGGKDTSNITISTDGVTYGSTVSLTSLAPSGKQLIKVKNIVGAPPQNLLPRNAYLRVTVGSWT